jgi:DNA-binding FadR family transcriptional regulator
VYVSGKVNHRDLVEMLKTGTKEEFRNGMYEHLKPHFEKLKLLKEGQ